MARPVLAAMAEQQKVIEHQARLLAEQRQFIVRQGQAIEQLRHVAVSQREQIVGLGRGLQTIAQLAGIEGQVRTAMITKRADEQNPAQPIPEPPAQPAPFSTQDAKTPEAFADVNAPGLVPGSTNDVAADTTSTVYSPGTDVDGPALKNLVDVTTPVDGTQGPRPLNEVRTLTDVRVGDPMNPQPAFPLRGDFANGQRLGAKEAASNRTMASLRLARLRLAAGTAQGNSDFEVATGIERDASMTSQAIESEIRTLEGVRTAAARKQAKDRPAHLVPRTASAQRAVPSMQGSSQGAIGNGGVTASAAAVEDSDLFLGDFDSE